jgi:hypothetical protein
MGVTLTMELNLHGGAFEQQYEEGYIELDLLGFNAARLPVGGNNLSIDSARVGPFVPSLR